MLHESRQLRDAYLAHALAWLRNALHHNTTDAWRQVRGPYGVGTMNEAGEELLSFLSMFNSRLCNTYFKKKAFIKLPGSTHVHSTGTVLIM